MRKENEDKSETKTKEDKNGRIKVRPKTRGRNLMPNKQGDIDLNSLERKGTFS